MKLRDAASKWGLPTLCGAMVPMSAHAAKYVIFLSSDPFWIIVTVVGVLATFGITMWLRSGGNANGVAEYQKAEREGRYGDAMWSLAALAKGGDAQACERLADYYLEGKAGSRPRMLAAHNGPERSVNSCGYWPAG